MLGGISFRRLEFGRGRRRVEKCCSTLTAELISWRVRSSACRARRVKPCPTFTAEFHSGGILMLAMRAPHSKGPTSSTIFWLIEDKPKNTSIYCTLCVTRIALAKMIVSKTTHSSDMFSAQIAFTLRRFYSRSRTISVSSFDFDAFYRKVLRCKQLELLQTYRNMAMAAGFLGLLATCRLIPKTNDF